MSCWLNLSAVYISQALDVFCDDSSTSCLSRNSTFRTASHDDVYYRLLILVDSRPSSFDMRTAARTTWMRYPGVGKEVLVKFMVFAKGSTSAVLTRLVNESAQQKDVVIFKDANFFPESERLLYELIWANASTCFHLLMKTEEHYYVRIKDILAKIDQMPRTVNVFWGHLIVGEQNRLRFSEPQWFLCDHVIKHPDLSGYIISEAIVQRLLMQANYLELYNNEAVGLSVWLTPFDDIHWKQDEQFGGGSVRRGGEERRGLVVFATSGVVDMVEVHKWL